MKKVLVIVLCVLILVFSSCTPKVPVPNEERTIETVRKEIGERISHYWEQNLDSLVTITQSLLRSSYTDVKFGNTAVICYKEALKSELSLEDIDVGLAEYYSLIMPFFDSISLVKAYQWTASIQSPSKTMALHMIMMKLAS